MESWNNIINTALLGTDKKQLSNIELSADLNNVFEQINRNDSLDKEDKFLQVTAVAFNYRQSGLTALLQESITIKETEPETKTYCNTNALHVLKDILEQQNIPLLKFWLQHCDAQQQIVPPEIIPALFDIAVAQKRIQQLITSCCGKRGEWLKGFNTNWNFFTGENDEDVWQNGTTDQRKIVLGKTRAADAIKAREWLQQTWQTENANTKAELLKMFEVNLSSDDVTWLESLQEEKSQKVKDVVFDLLKQIPDSSIVLNYWQVLQQSVVLKKEKALLGMISKTSLHVQLSGFDAALFKTGIEKLSNTKDFSDDEFIIYQLMQFVLPHNWELHFNNTPQQIIEYFIKDKTAKKFLPAFVNAIIRFKNSKWALAFVENHQTFNSSLIPLLQEKEQEKFSLQYFESNADHLIQIAVKRTTQWSFEFVNTVFRHTAKNTYQYNKIFYSEAIHLFPHAIVAELEKFTPQEQYIQSSWSNMSEYIMKLVSLKLQTIQAFNLK